MLINVKFSNVRMQLSARSCIPRRHHSRVTRLEAAYAKAFSYTLSPSLKNIIAILQNGQDKVKTGKRRYHRKPRSGAPCGP